MPEHLTQGSTEPPMSPGKIRVYGMRFCPFFHRVQLVLLAKEIPHDRVFINLKNKPDWYGKRVPSTKVPGLLVDNEALSESLIIADFLDEKYPQHPLHSKDSLQKAKDRILIENFDKITSTFLSLFQSPKEASAPPVEGACMRKGVQSLPFKSFVQELILFDKELAERGTPFFSGEQPGMIDYMLWPWFERFSIFKIMLGHSLPETQLKHLISWTKLMMEDQAVKEFMVGTETYAKFVKSALAGSPDYDIPL